MERRTGSRTRIRRIVQVLCAACCAATASCDESDRESLSRRRYYGDSMRLVPDGARDEPSTMKQVEYFLKFHTNNIMKDDQDDHGDHDHDHDYYYATRHSKKSKKHKKNKSKKHKKHKSKKHKSKKHHYSHDHYYYHDEDHHSHDDHDHDHSHDHSHDVPTRSPTPKHPTKAPTYIHSHSHSHSTPHSHTGTEPPTKAPVPGVPNPTLSPTRAPTDPPTRPPVDGPTLEPTAAPVSDPTASPSAAPVGTPSKGPTGLPSPFPTVGPTSSTSPTDAPSTSLSPSATSSETPTGDPTAAPTASPTTSPAPTTAATTLEPTATSTADPTSTPTAAPVGSPTAAPVKLAECPVRMWVNEFKATTAGVPFVGNVETFEFVEVAYSSSLVDLTDYYIIFYDGTTGLPYGERDLSVNPLPGAQTYEGIITQSYNLFNPADDILNDRGGIALVNRRTGTVYDFISYGGSFTAEDGGAIGVDSKDIGITSVPSTGGTASLQLIGAGSDADDFAWSEGVGTPNLQNQGQTIEECVLPVTPNSVSGGNNNVPNTVTTSEPTKAPVATTPSSGGGGGGGSCQNYIWINEFHYQNIGMFDLTEFVEVAHTANMDITGYKLFFYDGDDGTVYKEEDLVSSGLATETQNGVTVFALSVFDRENEVRNGPDAIAVVDAAGEVAEFISYGGTVTATAGPAAGTTAVDVGVTEPEDTMPQNSLQRTGAGFRGSDFNWGPAPVTATPGRINTGQTILIDDACDTVSGTALALQEGPRPLSAAGGSAVGATVPNLDLDKEALIALSVVVIVVKFLEDANVIDLSTPSQ